MVGIISDEEDADEEVTEEGDDVVIVARKHPERVDTYYVVVWHNVYPETLQCLEG